MLVVRLRDAMEEYRRRTGERMTYSKLSALTGMAVSTLSKIGSEMGKHTTLANVEKICTALGVSTGDLLDIIPDPPKAKPKRKVEPKPKRRTKKK